MKALMEDKFKLGFIVLSVATLLAMLWMSKDFGVNPDAVYQSEYGAKSLDFYLTLGKDDTAVLYKKEPILTNYGAFVELFPEAVHRITDYNLFRTRHFFNAFFSFFFILFASLIAARIAGWRAAILTTILLVVSPRLFAEAINNPKDLPFAAGYMCFIYYMIAFFEELPAPSWKATVKLMLALAFALSVRIGGLIVVGYFGIFLLIELWTTEMKSKFFSPINQPNFKELAKKGLFVLVFGYFLGILFWPAGISSCFKKPFESLTTLSAFPVSIKTMFEGNWIWSNDVPWYYIPKYILISSPEVVLVFGIMGMCLFTQMSKVYNWRRLALIVFSFVFPIFYIIYKKSPLYTGWRHSYFTYVPIAVLAAITIVYLIDTQKNKMAKYGVIALVALGAMFPLKFIASNYPNHYIYFNQLSGGINKAYGEYEIDYYHHSIMSAAKWIHQNHPEWLTDTNFIVTSNAPWTFVQDVHMIEPKFSTAQYSRYRERYDNDWDIGIFIPAFVEKEIMQNGFFPPKGTVHTIDIDGKPVCAIIKRENKEDLLGSEEIKKNNFPAAIEHLNKALVYDPNNEIALTNLGLCYLQTNNNPAAVQALQKSLEINPQSHSTLNYLGYAYAGMGNFNAAILTFEQLISVVPNMSEPYNILSQLYKQIGDQGSSAKYAGAYQQLKANGM